MTSRSSSRDPASYNRTAWDAQVRRGNQWTVPVSPETVAAARRDDWSILLTCVKPVPRIWFGDLKSARVLCLAGGGGQQGPILAAAGAKVTVLDNSPAQLERDQMVAKRENLPIETILGDMRELSAFGDNTFDLIVHPCSNCFIPDVRPVWREAFRVLKPGGHLISGFLNPDIMVFDDVFEAKSELKVRFKPPYSDYSSITDEERNELIENEDPFIFGHSFNDLIGGQIEAGFAIVGFYEDVLPNRLISEYMPGLFATRALKPV